MKKNDDIDCLAHADQSDQIWSKIIDSTPTVDLTSEAPAQSADEFEKNY